MDHAIVSSLALAFFAVATCLSVGLLIARTPATLVNTPLTGPEANLVHLVMNGGMAIMATSFFDERMASLLTLLFVVACGMLVIRIVWLASTAPGARRTRLLTGSAYHLLGLAAMIYAIRLMPLMPMHGHGGEMHGLNGMGGMAMPTAGGVGWIAVALACVFILDGIASFVLGALMPRKLLKMEGTEPPADAEAGWMPRVVRLLRLSVIPHVVMDIGMAAMLWA